MTNETLETMKARRSCRAFKPEQIQKEELEAVLEAGTYAASGMGKQSPWIIAVQDSGTRMLLTHLNQEILRSMGRDGGADPFYGAPTVIVVLANKESATAVEDGSLAIGNMMNAAASLGLGSCWIHRAKHEFEGPIARAMAQKWGIEGDYIGVGHIALGYPAAEPKPAAPRKEGYSRIV